METTSWYPLSLLKKKKIELWGERGGNYLWDRKTAREVLERKKKLTAMECKGFAFVLGQKLFPDVARIRSAGSSW